MATTIDDLSQAIMSWLDQRPPGLASRSPSPTWSTKELRDSFRSNLETALFATITAGKWINVVAQLANAFTVSVPAGGAVELHRWMVVPYDGPHPETFDVMRAEITQLLDRDARGAEGIAGYQPARLADIIVQALNDALKDEADRVPQEGMTPEAILHYYMIPARTRRKYNVRTFLFFFGLAVISALIYAVIRPGSWFNPATALFILLSYVTLIVTSIVYEHSYARS
jgi:hypothetical protein